jgi:hypothetical protein
MLNGMAAGGGGGSGASGASGFFRNQESGQDGEENVLNCSGLSRAEDRARPPCCSSVGPLQSHLAILVKYPLGALLSLAAVPRGHMSKNGLRARRSPALEDYCDTGPRMGEFGQGWAAG